MPALHYDLFKELLQGLEDDVLQNAYASGVESDNKDYTKKDILHHVKMLKEEGFINVIEASSMDGEEFIIQDITYKGHELLAQLKNDNFVDKAKDEFGDTFKGAAPGLMVSIMNKVMGLE